MILSQSNGTDTMYFQYDTSGTPVGFVYNGTQYFYMTNQMGDVIVIVEADGEPVCEYVYNEWGEIIEIIPVDEENAQQVAVANANPIRYRGYYYDSETGYYYLQSRYYDPSICRFINADVAEIANISKDYFAGTNAFMYCNNNPVNNSDDSGMITIANVIGAIVGALIGAVGGYFLSRWLADKIGLKGKKRTVFIAGLTAIITASAAVIGYFIGPYVAKAGKAIINALKSLAKNSGCFVAGTLISTAEGLVPIETLKPGDTVLAENMDNGEIEESKVTKTISVQTNTLYHIVTTNEEIITTPGHMFWNEDLGWVTAMELTKGSQLTLQNGTTVCVTDSYIEYLDEPVYVYNFEVEIYHTYYVGKESILVHNTCIKNFVKSPKSYKDVEKLMREFGYQKVRQNGSHVIFKDVVTGKTVVVPNHGSKKIAIGTLRSILKSMGLL